MAVGWMLSDESSAKLRELPETGMGFQVVRASVRGVEGLLLVLNSEMAFDLSDLELMTGADLATITTNSRKVIEALTQALVTIGGPEPHSFVLAGTRVGSAQAPPPPPAPTGPTGAGIVPPSSLVKNVVLAAPRVFHRFSAFNPDRRVDPTTGDFAPGTYAVPESELPFVPTGFAAVGRLALPNIQPASHHYVLEAPKGTAVSFGTVAPAFGQAGGGVEAFFAAQVKNVASPRVVPSNMPDE